MTTLFWVMGISLTTSFLCSILEAVLLSMTHAYVGILKEEDPRAGEWMARMQDQIDVPISAVLTLNTIANTAGAALGGALALARWGDPGMAAFTAAFTLAVLLFAEIVPKTIGATYWQQLARPASYVLQAMIVLMKPIVVPLAFLGRALGRSGGGPTVSRAELEILAEIGRREGTLDEDEWMVVSNVMRLDEVDVGDVMTPRTDMVAVRAGATVEEAKNIMLEEGHLRLPVFEENLDSIVGILLARDLWRADRDGALTIEEIVRDALFTPVGKPVEDLIPEMRAERVKMAIVLDEFGGTAGLVTLEDLIEEIIGEIQDEHESDEPVDFQELEEGSILIWCAVSLREVNERLSLELPEERPDTLGGFLFSRLSRVGLVGDVVEVAAGEFRITKMRGRRIEYAVFRPRPGGTESI